MICAHPGPRGRSTPELGAAGALLPASQAALPATKFHSASPGRRSGRPPECTPSEPPGGPDPAAVHPRGHRPLSAGTSLGPPRPPAQAFSLPPFCLLDPWPSELPANGREAPLAFRMKSTDFVNSSGHSRIRSGPCAFPTRRVKFVFGEWGLSELKNGYFFCVLTGTAPCPKFGPRSFLQCSPYFGLPDFASRERTAGVKGSVSGRRPATGLFSIRSHTTKGP